MCSANVQHCGFVGFDEMRVGKVESERVREVRGRRNLVVPTSFLESVSLVHSYSLVWQKKLPLK